MDFQGIAVYRPMSLVGVSTQRERIDSRAAKHRLDHQVIPRHGCIPTLSASVSPGKLIKVDCSSCCCVSSAFSSAPVREALAHCVGWGALSQVFNPYRNYREYDKWKKASRVML